MRDSMLQKRVAMLYPRIVAPKMSDLGQWGYTRGLPVSDVERQTQLQECQKTDCSATTKRGSHTTSSSNKTKRPNEARASSLIT